MKKENQIKIIGHCGVDSGQLLIVDPCYLGKWKDGEVVFDAEEIINSYDEACKITCAEKQAGQHSIGGVVTSTGYGDGYYPVTAEYQDGRIRSVVISFF